MRPRSHWHALAAAAALALALPSAGAMDVYTAAGANAASITPTVDLYRSVLGTLNPNTAGSVGSGRREINWDGVPDAFSAPNALPGNFFNVNSPRGVLLSTPGSGLAVSAKAGNPTGTPLEFGDIDASYPSLFQPFSPQRLFTAVGSNVVDVSFFVPGSTTAALTRGFGVVFSDVDRAAASTVTFYGVGNNNVLTSVSVPATAGDETFSFVGVDFGSAVVSHVRIVSGQAALGAGVAETPLRDLVVMDDFVYGEPIAAVPEPGAGWLFAAGALGIGFKLRRRA